MGVCQPIDGFTGREQAQNDRKYEYKLSFHESMNRNEKCRPKRVLRRLLINRAQQDKNYVSRVGELQFPEEFSSYTKRGDRKQSTL